MAEKGRSMLDQIKGEIKKASGSKQGLFWVKPDNKVRVRFLSDMEECITVIFHDKWQAFNVPCQKYFGKNCPYCDNPEARHTKNFGWSVYNYETKQVELFMFKANRSSPIPALTALFESYGTICDRDYTIVRSGSAKDTSYSIIPQDKGKFLKNVAALTKKKILDMLNKAFPADEDEDAEEPDDDDIDEVDDEEEDEEEEQPKKGKAKGKAPAKKAPPAKGKRRPADDDDEDEEDDEEDLDDEDDDDPPFDEDEDDDDEEEEEEPPRKKGKAPAKAPPKKAPPKKSPPPRSRR